MRNDDLTDIRKFYQNLIEKEYDFIFFDELNKNKSQVIIRHDIDFDVDAALKMAKIERELHLKSTYFFLISNDSYNLLSKKNISNVLEIKEMGHKISLHYDPTVYEDYFEGFKKEKEVFENVFGVKLTEVSIHRPNDFFINNDEKIGTCDHTYMTKYTKDVKYFSDSRGSFRYGHPFKSDEFLNNQNIQILIHPIWWIYEGDNRYEKLIKFYNNKKNKLKIHYSNNCLPFKKIINEIQ